MTATRSVRLEWAGEGLRFTGWGVEPPTPAVALDGDAKAGPGPMQALLLAAAGCSGADVVSILGRARAGLRGLTVDVEGIRRDEAPKRYVAITLTFRLRGEGLDRSKAERAVSLSLEKYCSVMHSLDPDIEVRHEIVLE